MRTTVRHQLALSFHYCFSDFSVAVYGVGSSSNANGQISREVGSVLNLARKTKILEAPLHILELYDKFHSPRGTGPDFLRLLSFKRPVKLPRSTFFLDL